MRSCSMRALFRRVHKAPCRECAFSVGLDFHHPLLGSDFATRDGAREQPGIVDNHEFMIARAWNGSLAREEPSLLLPLVCFRLVMINPLRYIRNSRVGRTSPPSKIRQYPCLVRKVSIIENTLVDVTVVVHQEMFNLYLTHPTTREPCTLGSARLAGAGDKGWVVGHDGRARFR